MKIFHDIKSIKKEIANFPHNVGFVPTMGALHDGHLSLIKKAKENCDLVVVSIFVNQKQFNDQSDYLLYPKTLDQDIKKIENIADVLFCPNDKEMYPDGFATQILITDITSQLCGKTRTGHFDGVALIVTKLFNIIKPRMAFFGEKDFQQLRLIKKLVKDLSTNVEIIGCKTHREQSGLAMSSRNSRLSKNGLENAAKIYYNLCLAKKKILLNSNLDFVLEEISESLSKIGKIDYLQICDEENLQPINRFNSEIKCRLFVAIYVEDIRLIDNIELY